MEEGRSASKMLTDKHTGNRSVGRPRVRWDENVRTNLKEVCVDVIY